MFKNKDVFILLVAKSIGDRANFTCRDGDLHVFHFLCTDVGGPDCGRHSLSTENETKSPKP